MCYIFDPLLDKRPRGLRNPFDNASISNKTAEILIVYFF